MEREHVDGTGRVRGDVRGAADDVDRTVELRALPDDGCTGWQGGDKKTNPQPFLDKGISVVAINYRYVKNGVEEKIEPPVKAPLEDAARALQFVRSKATEWNLDKKRIGATGGSCFSLLVNFFLSASSNIWPTVNER